MQDNYYKRLAHIEALAEAQKAETEEVLILAYDRACEEGNAEDAADIARKIRDRLLAKSDSQMSLDRLGLDTSSATKLIASLGKIFSGEWAKYRKALRDLPEQDGFPFDVKFPKEPNSGDIEEQGRGAEE